MEENYEVDEELKNDDYYESLIAKLYKPIAKPIKEPLPNPPLEVVPVEEPEPIEEPMPHSQNKESEGFLHDFLDGTKKWLLSVVE
jgi:hypothetical protein